MPLRWRSRLKFDEIGRRAGACRPTTAVRGPTIKADIRTSGIRLDKDGMSVPCKQRFLSSPR